MEQYSLVVVFLPFLLYSCLQCPRPHSMNGSSSCRIRAGHLFVPVALLPIDLTLCPFLPPLSSSSSLCGT